MHVCRLKLYTPVTTMLQMSANTRHRIANTDVFRRTSLGMLLQGLRRIYYR